MKKVPSSTAPAIITASKLRRSGNKNDPPFFSERYFQENHADLLCSLLIIICMAGMWQRTNAIATRFFWPSSGHSSGDGQSSTSQGGGYGPSKYDFYMVFFYTIIVISIHSIIKTYLCDKLVKRMKLSWARSFEVNRLIQRIAFESIFVAFAGYIYIYVHETSVQSASLKLIKIEPDVKLDIHSKFLLLLNICYWLHWPFEIYFDIYSIAASSSTDNVKRDEACYVMIMFATYFTANVYAYVCHYWTLAMFLMVMNYVGSLLVRIYRTLTALKLSIPMEALKAISFNSCLIFCCSWTLSMVVIIMNLLGNLHHESVALKKVDNPLLVGILCIYIIHELVNVVMFWKCWHSVTTEENQQHFVVTPNGKRKKDLHNKAEANLSSAQRLITTRSKAKSKKSQ
ncbi:hypothetical protein GJ496_010976 [Pomphorhynchus laevis]|nr:hypothetical protein GJ496_010976 [Pomphorhynchus laevis]